MSFISTIASIALSEEKSRAFLKERDCLRSVPFECATCGGPMRLGNTSKGLIWRCNKHRNASFSERHGSFWYQSRLKFADIIWLLYHWALRAPVNNIVAATSLGEKTVIQWISYFRNICSSKLNEEKIEGPKDDVVGNRKYYRGKTEILWRGKYGKTAEEAFDNILSQISSLYPMNK
eukprot:TRINITY_DN2232_c0_g1_i2.p1 TRINITY_DN2232_c0_g1~~TRINITY_DN2232_c0_g1_i2.p1  ORF type:complete len:177 (+),score=28.04 TRINITY_DN2232_c0_g1_i2:99-629(+)